MPRLGIFVFPLCFIALVVCSPAEEYFEELDIAPLPNGYLSSTFKFLTRRRGPLGNHYDLFPKAIGEIVQRYGVEEFHLTLSQNFWRTYLWGYQPAPATPTGAQLWAWFQENDTAEVDTRWRDFVHALSGLFCASFSQIDTRRLTIQPEREFRPRGVLTGKSSGTAADNRFLRYAILPSDNVCTENLTPWKKLLPCKSLAGIGSLLIGTRLFWGHYFALNVDLRRICGSGQGENNSCIGEDNVVWELTQTLTVVWEIEETRMAISSIDEEADFTLYSMFGQSIGSHCAVANSSLIFIDLHKEVLRPKPAQYTKVISNGNRRRYAIFDVRSILERAAVVNVGASFKQHVTIDNLPPPPAVYIHSFVAGSGLQTGRFVSRLFNTLDAEVPVLYSHTIPWFLRTYYHTLQIVCDGRIVKPRSVVYKPARDRKCSHYFEIALTLPPSRDSWCDLSLKFERALLRYGEYPPDANHGFPVAAPMISFYDPIATNHTLLFTPDEPLLTFATRTLNGTRKVMAKNVFTVVFGKSLLVNLPTPDFSMPYNVICLVCTVVALAFGPIHSLTTKTLTITDPARTKKNKGIEYTKKFKDTMQWAIFEEAIPALKKFFSTKILRRSPEMTLDVGAANDVGADTAGGDGSFENKKDK